MATPRKVRDRRRFLIGIAVIVTGLVVTLGISALNANGDDDAVAADRATRPGNPSAGGLATPSAPTTTTTSPPTLDISTAPAGGGVDAGDGDDGDNARDSGGGDAQPAVGATGDCRADPSCPSSEHRTSDPCGATVIVDEAGYLEGRRDAEQGLPYQIDGAPAPGPEDDDDDDATVGPQTRYRAGYVQGWCDGGGEPPA